MWGGGVCHFIALYIECKKNISIFAPNPNRFCKDIKYTAWRYIMACFDIVDGIGIIPEGTTEIGDYAFCGCTSLKSIIIPEGVTRIGYCAFLGCDNLNNIMIPRSVESISDYAFHDCIKLIRVDCKAKVPPIGGYQMFNYSHDTVNQFPIECMICVPRESVEMYRVADYWCKYPISGYDFEKDEFVEDITKRPLNNEIWYTNGSVTKETRPYREDAFDATILSNLFYVERDCWVIKFDRKITSIGWEAFLRCEDLISVTIPDSVNDVYHDSFEGCKNLVKLEGKYISNDGRCFIADGVLKAFLPAGITEYSIPDNVTTIGWAVFKNCLSITSINIPSGVKLIGAQAFENCTLTNITIPNSVTKIGERSFCECDNLRSVVIPSSVSVIEEGAFSECSSLENVVIQDGVTEIASNAFYWCLSLQEITIPGSVEVIGAECFAKCSRLKNVVLCYGIMSIGYRAFYNCIHLENIIIPNSVKKIEKETFLSCESLTNVTIPNSVTDIGDAAFCGCKGLVSVKIGNNLTYIGNQMFYECSSLTSIIIPDSVFVIGERTFSGCKSLTKLSIGDNVTTIGDAAFWGCSNLPKVYIPENVNKIGKSTFSSCNSLTEFKGQFISKDGRCLIIDGSLIAFAPAGILSYTIPNNVTAIGEEVFYGCISLTNIIIPQNISAIGEMAFAWCDNLTSIYCNVAIPPKAIKSGWLSWNGFIVGEKSKLKIYVPSKSIDSYKQNLYWADYEDCFVEHDFENDEM